MTDNPAKRLSPISSLFISPKLCVGFSPKSFSESEAIMSPTSILETKPFFSAINRPFLTEKSHRKPYCHDEDSSAKGLGLIDSLTKENCEKRTLNRSSTMVVFGSQLKIQIPSVKIQSFSSSGSVESPRTPIEFGIKNKNSQLALLSPAGLSCEIQPRIFTGCLSPREMELSEEYTCVISYGPNPKKTIIFDNYIVESCGESFMPNDRKSGCHS